MLYYITNFRSVAMSCRLGSGDSGCEQSLFHGPRKVALAMLAAMVALISAGCGNGDRPTLGQVHGHVTLDGKPLGNAGIAFRPEIGARESMGVTDANGEYILRYIREEMGGAVGKNAVRITTQRNNDPKTETLPEKYNRKTTLTAEVKPGENEINYDLQSK